MKKREGRDLLINRKQIIKEQEERAMLEHELQLKILQQKKQHEMMLLQQKETEEQIREENEKREAEARLKRERTSLTEYASRQYSQLSGPQKQLIQRNFEEVFFDTEILDPKQRQILYLNCAQLSQELPTVELSGAFTYSEMPTPSNLTEILTAKDRLVFIFKVGEEIFGAYSDTKWKLGGNTGNDNNFLFTFTKNHRMFTNRLNKGKSILQWLRVDGLGFGRTDLVLREDCSWSSRVDCDFSADFEIDDESKKSYIAGKYEFTPERLEIYHFDYSS